MEFGLSIYWKIEFFKTTLATLEKKTDSWIASTTKSLFLLSKPCVSVKGDVEAAVNVIKRF